MTERDAFELRFGAAVRGYAGRVSSDLDPVELAHRIAVAEPRRHGFAAAVGWRRAGVPRVAWVLLLLAAMLTAMVAGMLVVGSQPVRKLPAVVPPLSPAFKCPPGSTPDKPGPVDQARPAGLTALAFDRRAGRLVALAGADRVVETWTFDVCTNTWTRMRPEREPGGDLLDDFRGRLVYDVDSDLTIASDTSRMWAYDLESNSWTRQGNDVGHANLWTYDLVSGLVVAASTYGTTALWNYDVETDTWIPIDLADRSANGRPFEDWAYDASVDRLIAYSTTGSAGPSTSLLDLRAGTWSGSGAVAPEFSYPGWRMWPAFAYDEAAERTVMLGQGHSAAYAAAADRWETLYVAPSEPGACGTRPECRSAHQVVYDAVNERLVVYGGVAPTADEQDWASPDDVLAFDTRTREWTVLLEPSEGQAAP